MQIGMRSAIVAAALGGLGGGGGRAPDPQAAGTLVGRGRDKAQ
jgi:hypothetical protein